MDGFLGHWQVLALAGVVLLAFPKLVRTRKRRKRIPARSGRLKRRCVALRGRPPSPQTIAFAERCKARNIAQSSGAQPTLAVCAALSGLGIRYWREEITWFDGDRFVLSDFWLPDDRLTIELDGVQHRLEHQRDEEKARIIFESRGFRTVRFWNGEVMMPGLQQRLLRVLR